MKISFKNRLKSFAPNKENVSSIKVYITLNNFQLRRKKIYYPKKEQNNSSCDSTKSTREFGKEITNVNKNRKEIRYPKPSNSKENINNIKIIRINNDKNRKKSKIKKEKQKGKETKPNKSKLNLLLKKLHNLSIEKSEEKGNADINNNKLEYNENPIDEYEEEIMKNLFREETKNRPIYSLFPGPIDKLVNKLNLTYMKRFSFINLFISFQQELFLKQETLYLTINLFDRYIQKLNFKGIISSDINLIALTCLFIASKYEEIYAPTLKEFLRIFKPDYFHREIYFQEDQILSALDFEVLTVYPISFLKKFCLYNINDLNKKEKDDMELCYNGAQFFLEICLIEPKFCELKPSLQAAICLYLARKFLLFKNGNGKIWNFDLAFRTNYSEINIKKNIKYAVKTIKNFFENAYTKNYMSLPLYKKFCSFDHLRVAAKLKLVINGDERQMK